ncbi:YfdX family protein [Bombella sp. TMW 2.2543]|uniref:YfdX family protein n=1 Tax=Bombella pluederhausensis TaxID=2967336 RepID=A0ABT3WDB3_9PROT|nr:YfdX family protein [Bombella pluederhausensis]MCX5617079.1 YfdX family protein [Bombella pluederhausensis]
MRFTALHKGLALSVFGLSALAVPALADDTAATDQNGAPLTKHEKYETKKEHRAFHHLSENGQKAMANILDAQQFLANGQNNKAVNALRSASSHLDAAAKAREQFTAAEADLHPAPQHPVSSAHTAQNGPTDWIPVGGEVIATDVLEPSKKSAVATANAQLKAGQTEQAAQTLKIVGEDIDFVIALAPLAQLQGFVNRAMTFAQDNQTDAANQALTDGLNTLVFVSENVVTEATNSSAAKKH